MVSVTRRVATSLLVTISAAELMSQGRLISSATFRALEVYLVIAVIYFALCYPLSQLLLWLERARQRVVVGLVRVAADPRSTLPIAVAEPGLEHDRAARGLAEPDVAVGGLRDDAFAGDIDRDRSVARADACLTGDLADQRDQLAHRDALTPADVHRQIAAHARRAAERVVHRALLEGGQLGDVDDGASAGAGAAFVVDVVHLEAAEPIASSAICRKAPLMFRLVPCDRRRNMALVFRQCSR